VWVAERAVSLAVQLYRLLETFHEDAFNARPLWSYNEDLAAAGPSSPGSENDENADPDDSDDLDTSELAGTTSRVPRRARV
jgi:hypothetical protein